MIEFRDTLTGLIDEYGQVEDDQFELPKPAVIGDKRTKQVIFFETHNFYDMINTCYHFQFFLDAGQNQRGIFLRVTEQTRFYRQAITSKYF